MRGPSSNRQAGFTLVEIAIVMIMIGLLLTGILKGQEMIVQARIKNVINDFNGITAAYATYYDRYRAIPGDDAAAQGRWSLPSPASDPSTPGNGTVDGTYNALTAGGAAEPESRLFWWHLRQAGFMAGATTPAAQASNQPTNAAGGKFGVTNGTGPATVGLRGLIVCSANLPDKVALAVDIQLDDGRPDGGAMHARWQTLSNQNIGAAVTDYLQDGRPYLLCRGI